MAKRSRAKNMKEAAKILGSAGGKARKNALPAARRTEIARQGGKARQAGGKKESA